MKRLFSAIAACAIAILTSGCASTGALSPEGQLALETSVRIAVRHSLDTPRAIEKAQNIRHVAVRLQTEIAEDVTIATLTAELGEEIDKLGLDPISEADAHDLVRLLAALVERSVGSGDLKPEGVVKVAEFVDLVLAALPAG